MSQHASLFHASSRGRASRGGTASSRRLLLRPSASKLHMQFLVLLLFLVTCSWLAFIAHSQPAEGSAAALSQQLQHLQATFKGRVQSAYDVPGGYWHLDVNYSRPTAVPLLAKTRYRVSNKTCWELASAHPETLSPLYRPTRQPPTVSQQ